MGRQSLGMDDRIKRSIRGVLKKDAKKKSIVSIPVYASPSIPKKEIVKKYQYRDYLDLSNNTSAMNLIQGYGVD